MILRKSNNKVLHDVHEKAPMKTQERAFTSPIWYWPALTVDWGGFRTDLVNKGVICRSSKESGPSWDLVRDTFGFIVLR
jgi:hypothetical protein